MKHEASCYQIQVCWCQRVRGLCVFQHYLVFSLLINSPGAPASSAHLQPARTDTCSNSPVTPVSAQGPNSHPPNLPLGFCIPVLGVVGPSTTTHLPMGGKLQSGFAPSLEIFAVQVFFFPLLKGLTWKFVFHFFLWISYLSGGVFYGATWFQALLYD